MDVFRLSRRRQQQQQRVRMDPRSFISLDNRTAFEQVVPIRGQHYPSGNKAQYSNLIGISKRPSSSKSTRLTTCSTESLNRLTSESLLNFAQEPSPSSATGPPISQRKSSTENNNEVLNLNHQQDPSEARSRISLLNQNIESTYPQSITSGPADLDKPCSCQITMSYRSDPALPPLANDSRRDEVTIFQLANNGSSWIVFKGFLKMHDIFTFKSQRSTDDRFHLKLEINGFLDTTISACCEHLYRHGGRIDDDDSSFWIKTVEQYTSCAKCHGSVEELTLPDNKKMAVASSVASEESEEEDDQSVVSEVSTKKVEPSQMKPTPSTKPSTDMPSSPAADTKKVPEAPVSTPKVQPLTTPKTTPQESQSAEKESDLLQYVKDVMEEALLKPKPSERIPPRRIGNLENFTLLYIGPNKEQDLSLLRSTINFLHIINDSNTLEPLLATCTNEIVIVVISLDQAQAVLPTLQRHKSVQSIYLLSKQTQSSEWTHDYDKIMGIYRNIESIREHLIKTLPRVSSRMIPMEITSKESTTDPSFTYCQLLKETMLCTDEESDLKKDMLAFCRLHYADNQDELHEIDEFEKSFIETDSIHWYTRHSFVSKIVSRAFRTQEVDLLFKMRYFIQCLQKQIRSMTFKQTTSIYAIVDFEQEIVQKFQETLGELILFRSFLPGTFERPTSVESQNKDAQRSLVFSIRLESDCAANIEQLRSSDCKLDVLINLDTVFRIVSIDRDENGIHTVNLESITHSDSHFQQLTDSLRKEMLAPVVILQLSRLLLKTNHYWECDYLTEFVYQDKSFEGDGTLLASLAASHHLLGNINVTKRDFEGARYQFFKSLRAFQLFLPPTQSMLSSSYNNIGSMFYQDDHHEHAIKFHDMALTCQLKASNPDLDAVATYASNTGAVYIDQKKYSEALRHLERAATIRKKMLTEDNVKPLISLFQKISSCYWHTDKPTEALKYYKKTLDLQLNLPNPLPQPLSVTYYNLSTAYARTGKYDEAVTCAEKSIEYLKLISADHPELKENQAQLEIARQKQWLKQVLSV